MTEAWPLLPTESLILNPIGKVTALLPALTGRGAGATGWRNPLCAAGTEDLITHSVVHLMHIAGGLTHTSRSLYTLLILMQVGGGLTPSTRFGPAFKVTAQGGVPPEMCAR